MVLLCPRTALGSKARLRYEEQNQATPEGLLFGGLKAQSMAAGLTGAFGGRRAPACLRALGSFL